MANPVKGTAAIGDCVWEVWKSGKAVCGLRNVEGSGSRKRHFHSRLWFYLLKKQGPWGVPGSEHRWGMGNFTPVNRGSTFLEEKLSFKEIEHESSVRRPFWVPSVTRYILGLSTKSERASPWGPWQEVGYRILALALKLCDPSFWWDVQPHAERGLNGRQMENVCKNAWKKHKALCKVVMRKYPPHCSVFCSLPFPEVLSASFTLWHLSPAPRFCFLLAHQFPC